MPPPIINKNILIASSSVTLYLLLTFLRDYIQLPIYCYNIPLAISFICLGNLMRAIQYKWWILFTCLIVGLVLGITDFSYVAFMPGCLAEGESYLSFIVLSIAGIVVINNIFTCLCKWYSFPILSFVGRNSMAYFVIHMPLLLICTMLNIESSTFICFIIKYILIVTIITIINILLKKWEFSYILGE